ncbi:mCG1044775, partial [Mus musculus]
SVLQGMLIIKQIVTFLHPPTSWVQGVFIQRNAPRYANHKTDSDIPPPTHFLGSRSIHSKKVTLTHPDHCWNPLCKGAIVRGS